MKKAYLCLIIILLSFGSPAQTLLRWNYPCKPGTECWNALTSVQERQNACQIKGIDLKTLSTEELLLTTMEHPFFTSYVFSDNMLRAVTNAMSPFNGFSELLARKDAMATIKNVYLSENFDKLANMRDTVEMGTYALQWVGLELLMANDTLLSQLSDQEKVDFLKALIAKNRAREKYRGIFGGVSNATIALIGYKLIKPLARNSSKGLLSAEEIALFESSLLTIRPDTIGQIQSCIEDFLQSN